MIEIKIDGETYTSEQYKKDFIRYLDSLRQDLPGSLGLASCIGGECKQCILRDTCIDQDNIEERDKYYAFDNVLKIYKWANEHPIKTNRDKLKKRQAEKKLTREEFEKAYEIAFDGFTKEEISEYCDEHFCNHDCKFFKRCMVEDIMDQNRTTPINPIDAEEYAYEILKEAGLK